MKKYKKGVIIAVLTLVLVLNCIYGYYVGYNAENFEYYDKVISPDQHYAIEIHFKDNLLAPSSLIFYCEDLISKRKVEYFLTESCVFSSNFAFDEIFKLEWLDDRALLTVWQEEFKITTYILEWDKIF